MKHWAIWAMLLGIGTIPVNAGVGYTFIALDPRPGGSVSNPGALSSNGTVGFAADWNPYSSGGFLGYGIPTNGITYSSGIYSQVYMGALGFNNTPQVTVAGVNDSGATVGYSTSFNSGQQAYTPFGYMTAIVQDPQNMSQNIIPVGVANTGDVGGYVLGSAMFQSTADRAYIWRTDGSYVDFNSLGGFTASDILAMNANGDVAGWASTAGGAVSGDASLIFLYHNGVLTTFTLFPSYNSGSPLQPYWRPLMALATNGVIAMTNPNNGDIVLINPNGTTVDLGSASAANASYAINAAGTIVGLDQNSYHGFVYAGGVYTDLNTLIQPNSGYNIEAALAIDDAGQILAQALNSLGQGTTLLLTPLAGRATPEPRTILLSLAGIGVVVGLRRRQMKKLPV